jgi:cholesterol transport system auxiliary component
MKNCPTTAWLVAAACSLLTACALFSKAAPLAPRYFTPEDGSAAAAQRGVGQAPASETRQLRLGGVRGGSQLRERIMFRDSAHELGYYEDRRWTERPEAYLRRALARALFEERGLVRVVSGSAPTLDAELIAFEEIRAPEHKARVQVIITLDDDRIGSLQETITVEKPVRRDAPGDDADAAVEALAAALHQCVTQIADRVTAKLVSAPATSTPPEPGVSRQ